MKLIPPRPTPPPTRRHKIGWLENLAWTLVGPLAAACLLLVLIKENVGDCP